MTATSAEWGDRAKILIKAELKRANIKYPELAERLTRMGLSETDKSIAMKISRGAFPTWFLLAVMHAISTTTLKLEQV